MSAKKPKTKSKTRTKARASGSGVSAAAAMRDAGRYMMNTYRRPPLVFVRGRGCNLYDQHGRKYLDFLGGIAVNALGHAHPRMVQVLRRQAAYPLHVSNLYHHPYQGPLARKLAGWSGMDRVFFTNSGTEAVEGALKLARVVAHNRGATGKTRILALENSFHGRTMGSLSVTYPAKYREPFAPLVPGVVFVRVNDTADLEAKFDDSVCALVVEAIQGEGGVYPLSGTFWTRARELATQYGAALIADEIQCGLGRSGRPFAYQRLRGLAGYRGGGQAAGRAGCRWAPSWRRKSLPTALSPGMHGSTFGGGPLVCAAALEFLDVMEDDDLLENIRERGAQLRAGLSAAAGAIRFHPRSAWRGTDDRD